jgi:UDP-N-acetyl-2-amino-2-deoxyglucuronate dehydrogenase
MNSKDINFAVIGCGRIAGHHCKAITDAKGAKLIAVCDLDNNKSSKYASDFGVKSYNDFDQMLIDNSNINIVSIITPSGMHYEHALKILQKYKKDIIIEKPTFLKSIHFNEVERVAAKNKLNIFPVFQNRHNNAVKRVKKALNDGDLGEINILSIRVRWCRPQRYYDLAPWRGTFSMDGGCLTNQGIHHLDLMRYLGGEVKKVNATMRTLGSDIEVEDSVVATVQFENNAIGSIEVTTAARPDDFEASISIVGSKGLAQIGGIAVNELQVFTPNPSDCKKFSEDFSDNVYGNGHYKIYNEIISEINNIGSFSVTSKDARKTIELLNALYVSSETQKTIDLFESRDSIYLGREDKNLSELYRYK